MISWSIAIVVALLVAAVVVVVVEVVARQVRPRRPGLWQGWRRIRVPLGIALAVFGIRATIGRSPNPLGELRGTAHHLLVIIDIIAVVWLLAGIVLTAIDVGLRRSQRRITGDRERRRVNTQLQLIRRLVTVVFVVIGAGSILLTFPGVERLGTGILASAGLLSVVAGLAAQTSLANLFAGIQLTFSDALRIGDTVVVEDEYGSIEEITLTYVVVKIWDERRLVLPTTYFTTTPYRNWTRTGSAIAGTVYFTVDWRVDVDGLREKLGEILAGSAEWDGNSGGVVVTDATGGMLEVRASMSAGNADQLWVLQCRVREELAEWIRTHNPEGLPTHRVHRDGAPGTSSRGHSDGADHTSP